MSAQIPGGFDPRQHAPATGEGGQLPVSDKNGHLVVIRSSELKETSGKDGWLLALELEIVDGPHIGATGIDRLNLGNKSAETVQIALRQLTAICHCVNWLQPVADIACLHDKPFRVIVELQKDKDAAAKGYTQVRAYRTRDGFKPGEQASGPAPAPSAAPTPPPAATAPPVATSNVPFPGATAAPQGAPWSQPPQSAPPAAAPAAAPPWGQQTTPTQPTASAAPWAQQPPY